MDKILNKYTSLPDGVIKPIAQSFLPDKAKRNYTRIVNERITRFIRESEWLLADNRDGNSLFDIFITTTLPDFQYLLQQLSLL